MKVKQLTKSMYKEQFGWALWFLTSFVLIQVVFILLASYYQGTVEPIMLLLVAPSRIFMLVLGIISAYSFLGYYYHLGQTRKQYFKSSLCSTGLLTVTVIALIFMLSLAEKWILSLFSSTAQILSASEGTSIVNPNGHLDITMQFSVGGVSFVDAPVLFLLFFAVQLVFFFAVGWLISVGFYRYGWMVGLGFILVALVFLSLNEWMWSGTVREFFPTTIITIGCISLCIVLFTIIYNILKKTPIKMK